MKSELNKIIYKDYEDMSDEEKQIYRDNKGWVVTNYMGIKTSTSSLRARLLAYLDETKKDRPSIWD
jgi:cephalosporin hydroxylase